MSNEVKVFTNNEFGSVRSMIINNAPWFVGKDVAMALGYTNTRKALNDHVDDEDKGVTKCDTLGGKQKMTIINESGLYSLIMSSKLPKAKEFKHWVTSEVLPSIRKTGGYIPATTEMTDMEILAQALLITKRTIEERDKRIELLAKDNAEMKPKAEFADAVSVSPSDITIGTLAKILKQNGVDIGRTRLYDWMRQNKYLVSNKKDWNMPRQEYVNCGYFRIRESTIDMGYGRSPAVRCTTYVTGKGQQYFVKMFMKGGKPIAVRC